MTPSQAAEGVPTLEEQIAWLERLSLKYLHGSGKDIDFICAILASLRRVAGREGELPTSHDIAVAAERASHGYLHERGALFRCGFITGANWKWLPDDAWPRKEQLKQFLAIPQELWADDRGVHGANDEPEMCVLYSDHAAAVAALEKRLAASEAECTEQARLNGAGSEREARLMARLAEVERALRKLLSHNECAECAHEVSVLLNTLALSQEKRGD